MLRKIGSIVGMVLVASGISQGIAHPHTSTSQAAAPAANTPNPVTITSAPFQAKDIFGKDEEVVRSKFGTYETIAPQTHAMSVWQYSYDGAIFKLFAKDTVMRLEIGGFANSETDTEKLLRALGLSDTYTMRGVVRIYRIPALPDGQVQVQTVANSGLILNYALNSEEVEK